MWIDSQIELMYASLPRGIQSLGLTNIGLCIMCLTASRYGNLCRVVAG